MKLSELSKEEKITLISDLSNQGLNLKEIALKIGYTGRDHKRNLKKFMERQQELKEVLEKLVILEDSDKSKVSLTKYDKSNTNIAAMEEIQKMKEFFQNFQADYTGLKSKVNILEKKLDGVTKVSQKYDVEGLHIPNEYITTSEEEVDRVTYRINKDVREKFDKFCNIHKQYKKTSILSYALDEFIKRYEGK